MNIDMVKMIKANSIIDIKVSTDFCRKINALYFYIISERTPEEIEKYKQEAEKLTKELVFSEPWMDHLTTISVLIAEIEKKAIEQGCTYEKTLDELLKEMEDLTNKEEN